MVGLQEEGVQDHWFIGMHTSLVFSLLIKYYNATLGNNWVDSCGRFSPPYDYKMCPDFRLVLVSFVPDILGCRDKDLILKCPICRSQPTCFHLNLIPTWPMTDKLTCHPSCYFFFYLKSHSFLINSVRSSVPRVRMTRREHVRCFILKRSCSMGRVWLHWGNNNL